MRIRRPGPLAAAPFERRSTPLLVAAYGAYQAVHVVVNVRALPLIARGTLDVPAWPPPGGWSPQALHFLSALAVVDLLVAFTSLVFVCGYFAGRPWSTWLGTSCLSASVYAAIVFDYATWASGAWDANWKGYVFINLAFLPALILLPRLAREAERRKLVPAPDDH